MELSFIEEHLPKTLQRNKEYRLKVEDLFRCGEGLKVSERHLERRIVTNPKCFFDLVESNFLIELRTESLEVYYQLKIEIMNYLKYLFEDFPLNAKFIYQEAFLVVEKNNRINFITYLIKDIAKAYLHLRQNPQLSDLTQKYLSICASLFEDICSVCTLRTSELKLVTNTLSDFYYQQQFTTQVIGKCFRLLDAGLQERTITPYLYFIDNTKNDSLKVLYSNNKWPFSKGMTLMIWINPLKKTDCTIFWLKTDQGNELILRIHRGKVLLDTCTRQQKEKTRTEICEFEASSVTAIGIELQPTSEGLFKSTSYLLNLSIDGKEYKNIGSNIPKFDSNEFIVEYSLLVNFIGTLYSVIITAKPQLVALPELSKQGQYGICRQSLVWQILDKKVIKSESVLCMFNSERCFQGLLLNYVNDKNHACFQGRVSQIKYHKYDEKIVDIFLPFVYLLSLVKDKNDEWKELFDLILQYLLTIIGKEHIQTKNILLILYFLEINSYKISQSTLNLLYQTSKEHNNFYIDILVKYIDPHALVGNGLVIQTDIQHFEDPVEKIIFMFYLETLWNQTWNSLQGFEGWWSPSFFEAQKDHPYNSKDFLYDPKREGRVQWSVKNFITKDYCKCLVQPQFLIPQYGKLTYYQREYVKKQCFVQEFKMQLSKPKQGQILNCQKISNSSLDRLKNKLLSVRERDQAPKKKQGTEFKQFSTPCLYIDILTIVDGVLRITKDGFLLFTSKHQTKRYDHMCVKAFKNEYFVYLSVAVADIRKIYKKRFNATNNALFIKLKDGRQYMFHFYNKNADGLLNIVSSIVKVKKDAFSNYLSSHKPVEWIDKRISNYEYLQWLNEIAGRSYTDITQYPVLPWVFVSNANRLDPEAVQFRDLTKNMGLQGDADRVRYFQEKYNSKAEEQLFTEYHFGTHYSSSAIIFNFLIRIKPYSVGALTLQSGKFDCADRIFYSYYGSWNNAISSPTDLRELIPQLYTLPEMFINQNNYDYGTTQDKVVVDNVILPPWAQQNPYKFVVELRKSLESKYVSQQITQWIDLIYGYKQRGKDAIDNMNIFYPLTYQNCIDLDKVQEPEEKESFETQIAHFGQNPAQIIGNNPHPKRIATKANWQGNLIPDGNDMAIHKCFLSKAPLSQEKFLFKSVFEGRNSILGVKFIGEHFFFVLRKHEYYLFEILNQKSNFLSKEQEVTYSIQSVRTSINYKQLTTFVPIVEINQEIVIIGGFYNGYTQVLFLKQPKYNRTFKFPTTTITALAYHRGYRFLFIGDSDGYVRVYRVSVSSRQIEFESVKLVKAHDCRINDMVINYNANLVSLCSEDGTLSLYNAYSIQIVRTIRHPTGAPIHFAHITTSPLYAVVFYSKENSTLYVYSINGQLLDSFTQKTGFAYNMSVLRGTDSTQSLVYLNAQRQLFIWELPFLKIKRKVKVKKDDSRISCFQTCQNSKIAIAGTEDGALQIITNPASY